MYTTLQGLLRAKGMRVNEEKCEVYTKSSHPSMTPSLAKIRVERNRDR